MSIHSIHYTLYNEAIGPCPCFNAMPCHAYLYSLDPPCALLMISNANTGCFSSRSLPLPLMEFLSCFHCFSFPQAVRTPLSLDSSCPVRSFLNLHADLVFSLTVVPQQIASSSACHTSKAASSVMRSQPEASSSVFSCLTVRPGQLFYDKSPNRSCERPSHTRCTPAARVACKVAHVPASPMR